MPSGIGVECGKILTYPTPGGHRVCDILIVDPSFEEYLREDLAKGKAEKPLRCFAITEDNVNRYGYTLAKYLSYEYDPSLTPWGFGNQIEQIRFFERWEYLVAVFNSRAIEAFA